MKHVPILLALLALLIVPGTVFALEPGIAESASSIDWWHAGSGGGHSASGSMTLSSTIGQVTIGASSEATVGLCAGFRCGSVDVFDIYLPLALNGQP